MNQAAFITGASDRIGKEIALGLADMGYDIAIHYSRSEEKAKSTREEIRAKNVACEIFQADFKNPNEVIPLISTVHDRFNNLQFLVNNASLFVKSSLKDKDYQLFDDLFHINFKTPYILMKEFAKTVDHGMVINILDTKISKNYSQHFDYLLTKKFLEDLTKMSAAQLGPNIRVNAIAPGIILPPQDKDYGYINKLAKNIPLKKTGNIENIKNTVKYFVQNEFITGQIIYVDGGENL